MRKYIKAPLFISLLVIAVAVFAVVSQASAYTPPGQSSDNATDVIIWHGDSANITLSGNVTANVTGDLNVNIPGLGDDIENAAEAAAVAMMAQLLDMLKMVIEACIVVAVNFFAYHYRDRWLFVAAGFALMLYGFGLWDDYYYLSILLVMTGIYNLGKAGWDKKAWER